MGLTVFDGVDAIQFVQDDGFGYAELKPGTPQDMFLITGISEGAAVFVGDTRHLNEHGFCAKSLFCDYVEGPSLVLQGLEMDQEVIVRVRKANDRGCMVPHESLAVPRADRRAVVRKRYNLYV